jgi:hypothetical protein
METTELLAAIDAEIQRLQQAKAILSGSTKSAAKRFAVSRVPKKRHLSSEARAKIAAAQKARWAKAKRATK